VEYRESLYVGYRFFETVEKEVLFPFGYGLSYTTFAYENLRLDKAVITDQETLTVKTTIRNTGDVAGKEIVQLYVSPGSPTAFRPKLELKEFTKVDLQPGEAKEVTFTLDRRAFAHFSTIISDWQVESGVYRILVCASAQHFY
jgi:beta-glucosidase